MKATYIRLLTFIILSLSCHGCKKELEKNPNSSILVPTTPAQLQGLLDNPDVFAYGHMVGIVGGDNFFLTDDFYNGETVTKAMRNVYTWQRFPFDSTEVPLDWSLFYQQIFYANVVLERVDDLIADTKADKALDRIKGDALFKRAFAFFHLLQFFAPAYDYKTASSDPGIILRLKSEEDKKVIRTNVQSCYNQIISDLTNAKSLLQTLPDPLYRNRACGKAAMALLARVHLFMGSWDMAASEAAGVINNYDSLINYNTIDTTLKTPFPADNREVIYPLKAPRNADAGLISGLIGDGANVDSNLISSFDSNDLRIPLLFHPHGNTWGLRRTYAGAFVPFEGIALAEMYLVLAESNVRIGNANAALSYLEKLLLYRYKTGASLNLPNANQPDQLLARILSERRKELAFHGERWGDIKRLNKQGENIIQKRYVAGQTFTMDIQDVRYALPFPEQTVKKYGLEQNPR